MQQTINFLDLVDTSSRKNRTVSLHSQTKPTRKTTRYRFAKALDFSDDKFMVYPRWLTEKDGFYEFMYRNYEQKLLSIPQICSKVERASDEKYFISLFLNKVSMFKNLPHRIFDIILSQIGVKYFHTGDMVHEEARQMEFVGIVFVGSVQYSVGRGQVICEKGTVIMSQAFYGATHVSIVSREETIVLTIGLDCYKQIQAYLKEQINIKQADEVGDMLKSVFFTQLHLKDRRAKAFYNELKIDFYFSGQHIARAGNEAQHFYIVYKGDVVEQNHIYIREHNKWPLQGRKWQVRAVYNSHRNLRQLQRFDFFGDEEIIGQQKLKASYRTTSWSVLLSVHRTAFQNMLTVEQLKRLKKYRSQHIDINYVQFESKVRDKAQQLADRKRIVQRAIDTSYQRKNRFTERRISLVKSFEKMMLQRSKELEGQKKKND